MMNTNINTQERAEVQCELSVTFQFQKILLGIDWHAYEYRVVRMIDNAGPEPAQRFSPEAFLEWVKKQCQLAAEVYTCYEAGAGGYVLHRQLTALGVKNVVVAPRKLDRDRKGVVNDARDARELAQDLDRYVRGNPKALRPVRVPTPEQEQRRQRSRQRSQLVAHRLSLAAQGRLLLLGQGWRVSNQWWQPGRWEALQEQLPEWLTERLEVYRRLILAVNQELEAMTRAMEQAAPAKRPKGLGALTMEQIEAEVVDWERFRNRKAPGSYAGLVGGVSASGGYHCDLSITKAGNKRLRRSLIEAAWRWVVYQPQSRLMQRWGKILRDPRAHKRLRKRAIVALARGLLVDLWRWRTGRATPEQLGWVMLEAPVAAAR